MTGLGIGGVIPNVIALLSETAPKRYRVSAVMASFVGYSLGNATIGQVAAWLIPVFGWWIVFVTAGTAGLILFVVLIFVLPESIPLLAAKQPDSPRLRRLVARAAPELTITPETRFVLNRPANETKFSLGAPVHRLPPLCDAADLDRVLRRGAHLHDAHRRGSP